MQLFLKVILNAICMTKFIGKADGSPPLAALAEHGWFCDRVTRDPGRAEENALLISPLRIASL